MSMTVNVRHCSYDKSVNKQHREGQGKMDADTAFTSFLHLVKGDRDDKPIHSEDDIPVTNIELPMPLKEGQYDAVLVTCEQDAAKAEIVKQILEKFVTLEDGNKAEISTLPVGSQTGFGWIQSKFADAEEAVTRSTFMFLFMSEHFINDEWTNFMKDQCIQQSIEDADKKWCVVPLYTHAKAKCTYKIPWGLRSIKGMYLHKMLRGKTLDDVQFEDIKEDHIDPSFLNDMTKLLNSRLFKKLKRKKCQAHEVDIYKSRVRVEREIRLMEYEAEEKRTMSKDKRKLELQRETVDNLQQEEMRKIEAMEKRDLPDDNRNRIIGERHAERGQLQNCGPSAGTTCTKEICAQANNITQARCDPPPPVVSHITINIHQASGLMIGDHNIQTQTKPQNLDAQEIQESQCESTEEELVEIERTSGAQEGRDDKPEECETQPMKHRPPVENSECYLPIREPLTVHLSPDVKDKIPKVTLMQISPSSPTTKPTAAVTPTMLEDTKLRKPRPSAHSDPDQTRVKVPPRPWEHSADDTSPKRVVLSSTEHSSENQELSELDETNVKRLANTAEEESYADDTLVKTVESSIVSEEYPMLDATEVKQIAVGGEETTQMKTLYTEEKEKGQVETLVKEEYREQATCSGQPETVSCVDETVLKRVEGELTEPQPDDYAISVLSAVHIRENGSSVDPASYWGGEGGSDPSELPSNSSTLVPSVCSSCSDKTIVPET